jgi:hypothetical protein
MCWTLITEAQDAASILIRLRPLGLTCEGRKFLHETSRQGKSNALSSLQIQTIKTAFYAAHGSKNAPPVCSIHGVVRPELNRESASGVP